MSGRFLLGCGGALVALAALTACSDDEVVAPEVGTIEMVLTLEGSDQDRDGGTIWLDGEPVGSLPVGVRVSLDDLNVGFYQLQLTGITSNCAIAGDNPRSVRVRAGQTTHEDFTGVCESTGTKGSGGGAEE